MRQLAFVLGSLWLVILAGCDSGPRLYRVKGRVTYKGTPVPAGLIYFDPDPTKQNDGPQGYAFIEDGRFDTGGMGGKGIVGKAHIVRIQGFDGRPVNKLPMGKAIFSEYEEPVDFPQADSVRDFQVADK